MTFRRAGGCLALTVALVCAASAQSGVQADKQFQAALHKENVDGDLKAAIEGKIDLINIFYILQVLGTL